MRVIFSLTLLAAALVASSASARSSQAVSADASYAYSADATRDWYRQNGGAHATTREENGTSSWEGAGPFAGNPNGN